jgi:hypothetical protein
MPDRCAPFLLLFERAGLATTGAAVVSASCRAWMLPPLFFGGRLEGLD